MLIQASLRCCGYHLANCAALAKQDKALCLSTHFMLSCPIPVHAVPCHSYQYLTHTYKILHCPVFLTMSYNNKVKRCSGHPNPQPSYSINTHMWRLHLHRRRRTRRSRSGRRRSRRNTRRRRGKRCTRRWCWWSQTNDRHT